MNKNIEQLIQSWKNQDVRSDSDVHPAGAVELDMDESEGVSGGMAARLSDLGTCAATGC